MTDNQTQNFPDGVEDGEIKEGQSLVPPQAEDNDTPFSEPDDVITDPSEELDVKTAQRPPEPTHQVMDSASDIDSTQAYNEGRFASEASEPNAGNAVVDYHPQNDQRRSGPTDGTDDPAA